jgi:hypothetical protein
LKTARNLSIDAGTLSIADMAVDDYRTARVRANAVCGAPGKRVSRSAAPVVSSLIVAADKSVTEKILHVLRPYASNWSGTLGRGDLVIPQREIPRVIHEILNAVHELTEVRKEAPEGEVFQVLMESRRLSSVQDQLRALQKRFLIVAR